MTKLEMMQSLNKMQAAVQKLPDEFSVEDAEAYYDGRIRVRVDAKKEEFKHGKEQVLSAAGAY